MLNIQKSVNFSGVSTVEVNGEQKPLVYFNATVGSDGKHNVVHSVQNEALYKANKDIFKSDRDAFEDAVDSCIAE